VNLTNISRVFGHYQFQHTMNDCGVACAAMLARVNYDTALDAFTDLGLLKHRGTYKPSLSSNYKELRAVCERLGVKTCITKWSEWGCIKSKSIIGLQMDDGRNWHWVYAEPHNEYGIVVLDPSSDTPLLLKPTLEVCSDSSFTYEPASTYTTNVKRSFIQAI
jgi:ABC-type bacteriocin/lantibiotic exporter with double-glycine peptidase domain